jgi:hypothetical protein
MKHFGRIALLLTLTCSLCVPAVAAEKEPHGMVMAVDLVVARPIGIALTTVGALTFVVFLPFTAASGDVKHAAKALVVDPARHTFVRCLGCKV